MVSNYRKSPGRFGEINNEVGIERPPVRPSIAFPNARNVLHGLGSESAAFSMENSDSTPTTAICLSSTDADDMSSLGDDPSILAILFPVSPGPPNVSCEDAKATNSHSTRQTMTTLMDLFHPTESHSNGDPEPASDVVKKKKKKKKSPDEHAVKKTKDKKKKSKSKTKESKSKEDDEYTNAKKKQGNKKKKLSPIEPSSPHDNTSSNEPVKKTQKKIRKSEVSPLEVTVEKKSEKKQKKTKGEAVIPSQTRQELKGEWSTSKEKSTGPKKSSSQKDSSPDWSPATKRKQGHKSAKGRGATDDFKSRPLCTSTESSNSNSRPLRDSKIVQVQGKADDCSCDERSYYSCARSTITYDCFDLPDSVKHFKDNLPTATTDIGQSSGTQHRTLELAIALVPKERVTERNPKVIKRSNGHFLKRIFGESQGCQ